MKSLDTLHSIHIHVALKVDKINCTCTRKTADRGSDHMTLGTTTFLFSACNIETLGMCLHGDDATVQYHYCVYVHTQHVHVYTLCDRV